MSLLIDVFYYQKNIPKKRLKSLAKIIIVLIWFYDETLNATIIHEYDFH